MCSVIVPSGFLNALRTTCDGSSSKTGAVGMGASVKSSSGDVTVTLPPAPGNRADSVAVGSTSVAVPPPAISLSGSLEATTASL